LVSARLDRRRFLTTVVVGELRGRGLLQTVASLLAGLLTTPHAGRFARAIPLLRG
jgi:hypothetical protein